MTPFQFQISNDLSYCQANLEANEVLYSSAMTSVYTALQFVAYYYKVILLTILLIVIVYLLYKCYWSPVLYKKDLIEVGFDHIAHGKNRAQNVERSQKSRQVGHKLPPPYPNAWYALVESTGLKIGNVVPVDAIGLNLCVYRGEDGTARVVDAYCPHLGAHLGIGGTVCGNCIQCPFHQWTFGANGDLVAVPGVDRVPKGISLKTWPTAEVDGAVWVWYDAEGRPPLWTLEAAQGTATWGYRGRNEFLVSAHIQEIPENGADVAHLSAVHTTSVMSDIGKKYPFINNIIGHHVWSAQWTGSTNHIANIELSHAYSFMKIKLLQIDIDVQQIGPAHVRLHFNSLLGPLMIVQSTTPLGPLLQRVVHRVYTPFYNPLFGLAIVYAEALQFERDVSIWNNKRYVSEPMYAKTDKAIRAFRAWFSQFYSEHSVTFKDALQNPLDW